MSPALTPEQAARVERNAELVRRIAAKLARTVGVLSTDELISAGNEGLVQAALRYDSNSGASFSTFAYYRIRGAMLDAIRAAHPGRRRTKRALVRLDQTNALLEQAASEQRERAGAGRQTIEQRVTAARELVRRAAMVTVLSEPRSHDIETIDEDQDDPEQALLARESRDRVWAAVDEMEPTERRLLVAIYQRGETMAQYAHEKGTSAATISRRHAKTLDRLGKRVRAQEWKPGERPEPDEDG